MALDGLKMGFKRLKLANLAEISGNRAKSLKIARNGLNASAKQTRLGKTGG